LFHGRYLTVSVFVGFSRKHLKRGNGTEGKSINAWGMRVLIYLLVIPFGGVRRPAVSGTDHRGLHIFMLLFFDAVAVVIGM
jgi:hypothetical protein